MLEKLELRQKSLIDDFNNMNNQIRILTENLEQSKNQLNQIVGKHNEVSQLIIDLKELEQKNVQAHEKKEAA